MFNKSGVDGIVKAIDDKRWNGDGIVLSCFCETKMHSVNTIQTQIDETLI